MSVIQLLHGTDHIIEVPDIHIGNPHNDYGMGFYCTRVDEMAREWACKKNTDGFVNSYDFDTEGLKVLNLLDGTHTVLNWMALLLQFRTFKLDSEVAVDARDYLIDHYSIDLTGYDVVIGYRADDSYFQYAESFVSNTLPLRSLNKALKLGKLGEQTVVISQKGLLIRSARASITPSSWIEIPKRGILTVKRSRKASLTGTTSSCWIS